MERPEAVCERPGRNVVAGDSLQGMCCTLEAMTSLMGQIKKDTVWEGDVRLTGDVFVPAGVTLRIAAGARISFAARPHWSCSVFRRPSDRGDSIEVTRREQCDFVVQGSLEVAGTERAPVCLGIDETAWGGITAFARGRVRLDHAYLAGAVHYSVQAFDDARVEAVESHCAGSEFAVWGWGTSRIVWRGGTIGAERASVICCEGSRASVSDVDDRSGEGIAATDMALVRVEGSRFCGPRKHVVVARNRSWVKLSSCTNGDSLMDVVRLDDAHVEMWP